MPQDLNVFLQLFRVFLDTGFHDAIQIGDIYLDDFDAIVKMLDFSHKLIKFIRIAERRRLVLGFIRLLRRSVFSCFRGYV